MRWCFDCIIAVLVFAFPATAAPIHDAAKRGDVPAITAALEAGVDVNESDGLWTPLWIAARHGQEDAARLLIARGADVNLTTKSSGPPLFGAIDRKDPVLVGLLLSSGADPNATLKTYAALFVAVRRGCLECVTLLVEAGADVNALNQDREPAIHQARLTGHHEIADYLAAHGAVAPEIPPISARLGTADPAEGQVIFARYCEGCHYIEPGKGSKVGPNLWNMVGRQKASVQGFLYSETLENGGGSWGYEDLNAYFWWPKIAAPGTLMGFNGMDDETERANLVAYLRLQSDAPEPLP